ncbi:MAG: NAD(+)--dinitrogen-reductase ADP-D-ribosyltransferase [Rhodospirillaceae bacterium]
MASPPAQQNDHAPKRADMLPVYGQSTNLVGLPTGVLASTEFNDGAPELHISGVREMNPSLFAMLGEAPDLKSAAEAFYMYMQAMFGLDPEQWEEERKSKRKQGKDPVRRFRSSYLRLLRGWGYDNNSKEGAVLKGWVESRFGLYPTFHGVPILKFSSPAWMDYVEQKMSSRFHNNSIYVQLDLVYEFCQWALRRFVLGHNESALTLYRGVNDFSEHQMVERIDKRTVVTRLNSLVSFSSEREVADCFGDHILTAKVPASKVIFFNTLLPTHPLKGEGEYLVIGGDFKVSVSYA